MEGNHVLYHFLQKTLLESDVDQFRQLTAHLVESFSSQCRELRANAIRVRTSSASCERPSSRDTIGHISL